MKTIICMALLVTLGLIAGVTSASAGVQSARVPNLHGKKLPLSEALLRQAGLRAGREDCDCTFGVVIKSNWYVCMQKPAAGAAVAPGTPVWTYSVRDMSEC